MHLLVQIGSHICIRSHQLLYTSHGPQVQLDHGLKLTTVSWMKNKPLHFFQINKAHFLISTQMPVLCPHLYLTETERAAPNSAYWKWEEPYFPPFKITCYKRGYFIDWPANVLFLMEQRTTIDTSDKVDCSP